MFFPGSIVPPRYSISEHTNLYTSICRKLTSPGWGVGLDSQNGWLKGNEAHDVAYVHCSKKKELWAMKGRMDLKIIMGCKDIDIHERVEGIGWLKGMKCMTSTCIVKRNYGLLMGRSIWGLLWDARMEGIVHEKKIEGGRVCMLQDTFENRYRVHNPYFLGNVGWQWNTRRENTGRKRAFSPGS